MEANKVIFVGYYLKKDALAWFKPSLRDYLDNSNATYNDKTKKLFANFQ